MGTGIQKQSFQQRLGRINEGGEFTTRRVYVGPVENAAPGRASRRTKRIAAAFGRGNRRTLLTELVLLPVALALGALAVIAARAATFHFLTEQPVYTQYAWYADLALAAVLALILRSVFRMSGRIRGKAFLAGFIVMVLFQALFVVRAPEAFALLYSEAYVADAQALVGPV